MRNDDPATLSWQIPIIIAIGVILVVLAAFLMTQLDGIQRRSLLPPKRLTVIDQDATINAEGYDKVYLPGNEVLTATPTAATEATPGSPTPTPGAMGVAVLVPTCDSAPEGWTPYIVQQKDSLSSLAIKYGISKKAIVNANCLAYEQLILGQVIYLPQSESAQSEDSICGVPQNWIHYVVHPGDTLLKLAEERNSTVYLIMQANCLESTNITPGRKLFLPPVQPTKVFPTRTLPTATRPFPIFTPTNTPTRFIFPTPTPTASIIPSLTGTATATQAFITPSATPTPVTQTPTAAATQLPTATFTGTPEPPTATATNVIPSETPTLLPTDTMTPLPTETPTEPLPTATPSETPPLPTATGTPIPPTETATTMPPTETLEPTLQPTLTGTAPVHPPAMPSATVAYP